ncbi:MAG: PHP domain-containing protein [Firmicutes bacterium]|jgi:hypothetical protein|nr:PHP domain-containing protein [Bacillota bacterium]
MIDLHCHSYFSDGTFSPEEIVIKAKKRGLRAIALTDHDTIDGLETFQQAGQKYHIETITGIEFAAQYNRFRKQEIHIVGLGFSLTAKALTEQMKKIVEARQIRNEKMIYALNQLGFDISYEQIKQNAGGNIITRAHFANVLVQKNIVKNTKDAFDKYLSTDKPAYVQRQALSPALCIQTIQKSGGVAVLAHPTLYHMDYNEIELLSQELKSYGLNAIETQYSSYSSEQSKKITALADKIGLLYSGGSDFHGKNKPNIDIGVGKNNLHIPYSYWEALKKHCI